MSQAGTTNTALVPGIVLETLTGNTGGPVSPDASHNISILGGGGISVSGNPGTNTLTITGENAVFWQTISASTSMAANNGYICISPGGALSLALPATSAVGDILEITVDGATSFSITQGGSQQIRMGNTATTLGVGGSLTSTQQGDSVRMVCSVTNLKWNVLSSMGNPTIV